MLAKVWWKVSSEAEFTAIEQQLLRLGYKWFLSRPTSDSMRIALEYGGMALNDESKIVFPLPTTSYKEINPQEIFEIDIGLDIFDKIVKDVLSGKNVFVYFEGRKCKVYLSHYLGFMVTDIVGNIGKLTPELCKDMDMSTTILNGQTYLTAELNNAITKANIYPVA